MKTELIGLDELTDEISDFLAVSRSKYRALCARILGVEHVDDDEVLLEIDAVLSDPYTPGHAIVDLANELFGAVYSYEGDSIVRVLCVADESV